MAGGVSTGEAGVAAGTVCATDAGGGGAADRIHHAKNAAASATSPKTRK
jgi:hypothetical protein